MFATSSYENSHNTFANIDSTSPNKNREARNNQRKPMRQANYRSRWVRRTVAGRQNRWRGGGREVEASSFPLLPPWRSFTVLFKKGDEDNNIKKWVPPPPLYTQKPRFPRHFVQALYLPHVVKVMDAFPSVIERERERGWTIEVMSGLVYDFVR